MDRRKGRPHPQPNAYKVDHPYQLLALYTIWDALKDLEDAEDRAWFNLDNPSFVFWCGCAGIDAQDVRDRAYTLIQDGAYTMDDPSGDDCVLREEPIRSSTKNIEDKTATPRVPYSKLIIVGVLKRDEGKCRYCGSPAACLDHVRPHYLGGTTTAANLVASCKDCNLKKGSRRGFRLRFDPRGNGGGKGSLLYRERVVSALGLFGCKLWKFVQQDEKINPIGRPRKRRTRRRFPPKITPFTVGEDERIGPLKPQRAPFRPNIPFALLNIILSRDCWKCRYCGAAAVGVDHLLPTSKGGKACETNLVASCARCNNIKNDRPGFWLRYDPRLTKRGTRFFNTHPYGQKGTLWYRNKVISPRGLFGDEVWNYIKSDTNKKGRRKFGARRKRGVSAR